MFAGFMRGVLLCVFLTAACTPQTEAFDPFEVLSQAYADHDAALAAGAYSADAVVVYAYEGAPEERHVGRAAIEQSFATFFAQFPADSLDLSFRFAHRDAAGATGVYRLSIGDHVSYGRFDVAFEGALFARDTSTSAGRADFEALPSAP